MVWIASTIRSRSSGERSTNAIPIPGFLLPAVPRFTHWTRPGSENVAPLDSEVKRRVKSVPTLNGASHATKIPIWEMLVISA